jgi:hypothetical protein
VPVIIKTIDQIMDEEKRDMFFIRFGQPFIDPGEPPNPKPRQEQLAWFKAKGLTYATAAPRGWLEGDPGNFAVYFDNPEDPRVAEYTARFENADGGSLDPDAYQMVLITYQSWLDNDGPGHLARESVEDRW